jgi:peptide/nickel transport system permease protein
MASAGAGARAGWRLWRSRRAMLGLAVLAVLCLAAVFAPLLAPADPEALNPRVKLLAPLAGSRDAAPHLFGTDPVGRDIFSRVLFGGRVSLGVALAAILLGGSGGVVVGLVAGYYGGPLDDLSMRLADIQLSIPTVLLAIGLVAIVGRGIPILVGVLALTTWIVFARTVRGTTLALKHSAFVDAAKAAGASDGRILLRQVLPNAWTPIIVLGSQQVALLIILESSLSFLGVGAPADLPSWGSMVADARDYVMTGAWWLITFPGLAISVTVLAINFFGDGLRDALDPRLRL